MTVNQVTQGLGSWSLRLRADTPREVLDSLDYFGHIAIMPGRVIPAQYGDNLLTAARYVGVNLGRTSRNEYELSGQGMAWWLGDGDDKGAVLEAAVNLNSATFLAALTALRPDSVVLGNVFAVAGTYTGSHRWQTPRKAITYVCDIMGTSNNPVEWRVNGDATLDAGPIADLYRMDPQVLLVSKSAGRELARRAVAGKMQLATDTEDYATRVVVLAEGEGEAIATGTADVPSTPYRDMHGNDLVITRLVSSAETSGGNANAVAQLQLNRFVNPRQAAKLSSSDYFVAGDLEVGDYISVFDPTNGYEDTNNEAYWQGQPINPINLRCVELAWPVESGWTVAYRNGQGEWTDLSDYYIPESGQTEITVGEFSRALSNMGSQPVGTRPVGDSSVPGVPAFTGFSPGSYMSADGMTRSAIRAQWSTPLNTDGTTIKDGHHYEIRYRVSIVYGYQVTHDEMAAFSYDDFGTYDAPLSSPIQANREWLTAYVPWGTNAFTLTELTPTTAYELQIRGVDSAAPPNNGAYSASEFVATVGDSIAPSPPAAPTVAGSLIAIQVVHSLGKVSGGTFNLEPDLHHLNVHIGGSPSFLVDDTNKLGEMLADFGMMLAETPAIGSFAVEHVEEIYVKVVAVDASGNKSGASEASTVTAELIDDAHISSLTVSKVTAGSINAAWVMGARITTGLTGQRIELNTGGLWGYNGRGALVTTLDNGADPRLTFFQGTDLADGTAYSNPPIQIGKLAAGNWAMNVQDLFGTTRALVGQLVPGSTSDTDYGIAMVDPDTGDLVNLTDFVFGPDAISIASVQATSSTTFTNLATIGPTVQSTISQTGKALVLLTTSFDYANASGGTAGGFMSFTVTGPTGTLDLAASEARCVRSTLSVTVSTGTIAINSGPRFTAAVLVTGLTKGLNTFTAVYKVPGGSCQFYDRNIAVFPY